MKIKRLCFVVPVEIPWHWVTADYDVTEGDKCEMTADGSILLTRGIDGVYVPPCKVLCAHYVNE